MVREMEMGAPNTRTHGKTDGETFGPSVTRRNAPSDRGSSMPRADGRIHWAYDMLVGIHDIGCLALLPLDVHLDLGRAGARHQEKIYKHGPFRLRRRQKEVCKSATMRWACARGTVVLA